eukprot:NODE_10041_length_545_cov_55.687204_g9396_i0.p1 GENE.NODE_10041_length_545_cov_55.687204_g9396_i0~~NODE_10041_length_545_cov_55.687204_g9396_i0.p1  ORF type:complete len:149 (-),score=23.36 NODE_10041_length_545_cov_55.687204_g9396_i0:46-492(-)
MVWDESRFQDQNAKDTRRVLVAPSSVLVEDGLHGTMNVFIRKDQKLPCSVTKEVRTSTEQSTVPLRIFVGNSTVAEDRHTLVNVGFLGITGFEVSTPTTLQLTMQINESGIMTLSAVDPDTQQQLSIGPGHQKKVTKKIFETTYHTMR